MLLTLAHVPLPSATTVLVASITSLTAYLLSPLFTLLIQNLRSPLRLLPGPPSASFLTGNLADFADQENNDIISQWIALYGRTLVYRGFLGGRRLLTTDPAALTWILGHAYEFPKPEFVRESLAAMAVGHEGLVVVEGETHRRQRKIMNQAFTSPHIKSLAPIFYEKACELRDILVHLASGPHNSPTPAVPPTSHPQYDSFSFLRPLDPVRPVDDHLRRRSKQNDEEHGGTEEREGEGEKGDTEANFDKHASVDVLSWLGRAALDVIGEAGFGYQFNSLRSARRAAAPNADPFQGETGENTAENELANAFGVIFSTARKFRVFTIFQVWFPILRRFRTNNKTMADARATMHRIGSRLIAERRADDKPAASKPPRDILTVLVRASAAAEGQGLSESEVLSQIATFIAAGHETSASALTWTLYALARRDGRGVQAQVRAELRALELAVEDDGEELLACVEQCTLLDRVVREALRLHAPVGSTMRVYDGVAPEVVVPVAHGVRVRRDGEWAVERAVRLRRGDIVTVPIQAVNRCAEIWGEDAKQFRPDRWLDPPAAATAIQGLYSHTLTFLNGAPAGGNGHRGCIGYRFALAEIKVFLFTLLRNLEFTIDDDIVIEKRVNVVTRPFVKSAPGSGNQMPLHMRVVSRDEEPEQVSAREGDT